MSRNEIKVSVILPIFNAEKTLTKTLNSIIKQTLKEIEIIAINDGSSDKSGTLLKKYAHEDSRIKVLNQANSGVSYSRNRGLDNAEGEYVFFIDSDDWIDEDTLEKMYNFAKQNQLGFVACNHEEQNSTKMRTEKIVRENKVLRDSKDYFEYFDALFFQSTLAKLFKLDQINYKFDEQMQLGEDLAFTYSFFNRQTSLGFCAEGGYHVVNQNPSSLSKKYISDLDVSLEKQYKIWEDFVKRHEGFAKEYSYNMLPFGMYMLMTYFSNLNRYDCPLSYIQKYRKADFFYNSHLEWAEKKNSSLAYASLFDKVAYVLIPTGKINLILFTFSIKEKMRRAKFFIGRIRS
ncbi:glycosyltransferase family 2 protein [Ligilactobacillus saerimneri]|uniref:glycosyltransferase family 2 protein n=1 Tax=Ligilactobacillus saerimneri TaxID=228229 RepID=UPI0024B0CF35|nr:glycosyltransferase family 2 protein [Ligilactobacillus saerimneri]MDI9206544.1 glycosyltransferase family 2 protein [Ligilactobacillus saerimneri]